MVNDMGQLAVTKGKVCQLDPRAKALRIQNDCAAQCTFRTFDVAALYLTLSDQRKQRRIIAGPLPYSMRRCSSSHVLRALSQMLALQLTGA